MLVETRLVAQYVYPFQKLETCAALEFEEDKVILLMISFLLLLDATANWSTPCVPYRLSVC